MSSNTGHASLIGASFGQYEVQSLVGRGAMGTVYLARDLTLKRPVALKVLLGHLARNPLLVRRFHREAQATAHLRHPNIVRIYSAGVEGGTPYIAMEYVEGEPLDRFLRREGALEWQRALHIGRQTAEALAAAHAAGITHRDVKPANIMLDQQGRVRLTDFGIAQIHAELDDAPPEESFVGTPRYMSPEQCAGSNSGPATDLFSLGIVLFEMIAGQQPFQGETALALIKRITNDDPPRLNKLIPQLPDDVARLVAHLLEKRPEDRPASAAEVVARIAQLLEQNGGRSALPDALTAYIREQAQPRVLVRTPVPPAGAVHHGSKAQRARTKIATKRLWRICAAAVVMIAAALTPPMWRHVSLENAAAAALPQVSADVQTLDSTTTLVRLVNDYFRCDGLGWDSRHDTLMVAMAGRTGSRLAGARGLIAVDLRAQSVASMLAPLAPALSADAAKARVAAVLIGQWPTGKDRFGDIVYALARADAQSYVLGAHSSKDSAAVGVWTLPARDSAQPPWSPAELVAAIRPDQSAVCLIEPTADGRARLVQYTLPSHGGSVESRTILESPRAVASVAYSPSGDAVVFHEGAAAGARALYYLPLDMSTPQLLCSSALDSAASFSPDGRRLAYTALNHELHLLDLESGEDRIVGTGRVGNHGWHSSGAYLVASASAPEGLQLWALETSLPYRAQQLTRVLPGVRGGPEVSRDGGRAAAMVDGDGAPEILVVELERIFSTP